MLIGGGDIVGDLAPVRKEYLGAAGETDDLLGRLELLAAAAVELGMSYNIVNKASDIPREHIHAVLDTWPTLVSQCASDYERHASGVVSRRDR